MANAQTLRIFQFNAELQAFADKIQQDLGNVVADTAVELFAEIVAGTPVDTGRARSSWNISLGTPDLTTKPEGSYPEYHDQDAAYQQAENQAESLVASLRESNASIEPIYIANALEYISGLEDGNSKQAPVGMVEIALQTVDNRIATKVR